MPHPRPSRLAVLLALMAPLAGGCVTTDTLARASSGPIGCPSNEVRISDQNIGQIAEWRAECRGQKFICSATGKTVNCTPEIQPPPRSAAAK